MRGNRSTIKDVARQAGVSISIVSYVLNNTPGKTISPETKQRILTAAIDLDYSPDSIARGMRSKRSMALGLVSFWKVNAPVFIDILDGVTNMAGQNDYRIVLCGLYKGHNEFEYADLYKTRNLDGVILVSPPEGVLDTFNEMKHIDMVKKYDIPTVVINGYTDDESVSYIYFDYYQSTYMAANHLIRLGHRKLAYLLPDRKEMQNYRTMDRLEGYKAALSDSGIGNDYEVFSFEEMEKLLDNIKSGKGATGIVVNKANFAADFLIAALKKGIRVPADISVISANTEPYAKFLIPPLTSVEIPIFNIGREAVNILIEKIEGKSNGVNLKFQNTINQGQSCKRV